MPPYFLPLLGAIPVWLSLRLTSNETHTADVIIFLALVAVEVLVARLPNRKPKPPTSVYSLARQARLLFVPAASLPKHKPGPCPAAPKPRR